jgi:hypothetical protein
MKKEKINVIKLLPFFVPLKDKSLNVYGKIYSLNNSIYWDVNYYYKPTPGADYIYPSRICSSIEEAVSALNAYMKCFTEDYVYNSHF